MLRSCLKCSFLVDLASTSDLDTNLSGLLVFFFCVYLCILLGNCPGMGECGSNLSLSP